VCGQHHAPAAFPPGKDPVPIVQEAGWVPEPVWIGAGNLAPPGFDPRVGKDYISRRIRKIPYYKNKFVGYLTGKCNGDYQNL
jgi:hypothetical protein